ncbi:MULTISPECIES: AAA family ATPase [Brachybacterium]|uniref:AAA family ATPase n=1 Tax=Brachybacterium tyrofermentans TaxID=47848 RepID=A0ABW0FDL0_9MICO|nr:MULTISPECIES: ATP-binding protein [Brachybacterium]RCS64177.1 ATP-binding protein [Brachybacterium alimentarium]RCS66225.1 ATP-binding protein [Brachybacterium sp. JB7]RCS88318.1 ATP-binding protein [Brachybacterium alimentarium]
MVPADPIRRAPQPLAVLLAGLTGSGKTTVATALTELGFQRLSVDEEVFRLHGRYGIDYPEDTYFEREQPVVDAVRREFTTLLHDGMSIVLDYGLWTRAERTRWRDIARGSGGIPVLIYLPVERDELLARLTLRNHRSDANSLTVTESALDDFIDRFEPPQDDEPLLEYSNDLESLGSRILSVQADPQTATIR